LTADRTRSSAALIDRTDGSLEAHFTLRLLEECAVGRQAR
jgi:hypothetical protein